MTSSLLTNATFYQFLAFALTAGIGSLGVALGQARISQATSKALFEQPSAAPAINRSSILALALCETTFILTIIVVVLALFSMPVDSNNMAQGIASLAQIFAAGLVALTGGYMSSYPAAAAIQSTARQPNFAAKINMMMLFTIIFIQTPVLLGTLLGIAINREVTTVTTYADVIPLLSAGLCYGLGTIGPLIGLGRFSQAACLSVGRKRSLYRQLFSFSFVAQALIEAPILFVMLVSFSLVQASAQGSLVHLAGLLVAGLLMGLGTCAPGLAAGRLTAAACTAITDNPNQYNSISSNSFICQALIDTPPLFCLVLSLIIAFFK